MNKNYYLIIGVLVGAVVLLSVIAYIVLRNKNMQSEAMPKIDYGKMEQPEAGVNEPISNLPPAGEDENYQPPRYLPYQVSEVVRAVESDKKLIYFFHAPWCPFCTAADKDITANIDNIPEDVVILKVDYDTADNLKKAYNVTTQHTFVQLDKSGEAVTSWVGGETLADIVKNIK